MLCGETLGSEVGAEVGAEAVIGEVCDEAIDAGLLREGRRDAPRERESEVTSRRGSLPPAPLLAVPEAPLVADKDASSGKKGLPRAKKLRCRWDRMLGGSSTVYLLLSSSRSSGSSPDSSDVSQSRNVGDGLQRPAAQA